VGSLTAKIKVEGLLSTLEQVIMSDAPTERFKKFAEALEDEMVELNPSTKHMVNRDIGKLDSSPTLKYRAAA
jgi:hypothetical protein